MDINKYSQVLTSDQPGLDLNSSLDLDSGMHPQGAAGKVSLQGTAVAYRRLTYHIFAFLARAHRLRNADNPLRQEPWASSLQELQELRGLQV